MFGMVKNPNDKQAVGWAYPVLNIDYWKLNIDSQAEFRFFEKGRRMGKAELTIEYWLLNIDSQAEFRFFDKAFIPRKSKIRNPREAGKLVGWKALRQGAGSLA